MKKKKVCFIVNPISGVGRQKKIEALTQAYLNKDIFDYKIQYTQGPKDATKIAKSAANSDVDIVAIVGGDGSVNEAATGLINTTTPLVIIPAGSGNGLARHLKMPINLKKAIQQMHTYKQSQIDTATLNGHPFFNVAGIGFDALIANRFDTFGKRGISSYIQLIFKEFFTYQAKNYQLFVNNKRYDANAFSVSFCNGSQFGNNAYISPQANISDGKLNVAILKKINAFNVFRLAALLLLRRIHRSNHYLELTGNHISIIQEDEFAHIDGDPIKCGKKITVELKQKSLLVLTP